MNNNQFNVSSSSRPQNVIQKCEACQKREPKEVVFSFAINALKMSSALFGLYGAYHFFWSKPEYLNEEQARNFVDLRNGHLDPNTAEKSAQEMLSFGNEQFRKLANVCMLSEGEKRLDCESAAKVFTDHLYSGEYKNRKAWPLSAKHFIDDCLGNSSSFCSALGKQIVDQSFRTNDKSYPEELIKSCQKSQRGSETCKDIFSQTLEHYVKKDQLSNVGRFTSSCAKKTDPLSEFIMSNAMKTSLATFDWKAIGTISKACERSVHKELCQDYIDQVDHAYETIVKNSSGDSVNEKLRVRVNQYVTSCINQERDQTVCLQSLNLLNDDEALAKIDLLQKSKSLNKKQYFDILLPKAIQSYEFSKVQSFFEKLIKDEKQSFIQEIVSQYLKDKKFDHMIALSETILKQNAVQYADIIKQTFDVLLKEKRYTDCYQLAKSCLEQNSENKTEFCFGEVEAFINHLFDVNFDSQDNWNAYIKDIHDSNPFSFGKSKIKPYYRPIYTIPSSKEMKRELINLWARKNEVYHYYRHEIDDFTKDNWKQKINSKNDNRRDYRDFYN